MIQYRDQIMPLIYLTGYGQPDPSDTDERLNTVVYAKDNFCAGIVVGQIMDIVHENVETTNGHQESRRVINDRVTEIVDLTELVHTNFPESISAC